MHTKLSHFINFFFIIFLFFLLASCDSESPSSQKNTIKLVRPAKLIEIGMQETNAFLKFPAVVHSEELSVLRFEIGGMLTELNAVEAQRVKKGDVLAKLDQQDLITKLKSARAEFKNVDAEYQRALRLIKQDAISQSEFEKRKSQRDVKISQLETAQKALKDSELIAPYSGAIAKVSVERRQIIQPGEAAITLLGKKGLTAKFNLPASILAKAKGSQNTITDSYIVLSVAPDHRLPAVFKEVSLEADPISQTYEVSFTFDAPEDLVILPGMNATAFIRDPRKENMSSNKITIPLTAIAADGANNYVWVVDKKTMKVSRRNVVVEDGVGINLNIKSGLEHGDMIVSAGISSLYEGMEVRPWVKQETPKE